MAAGLEDTIQYNSIVNEVIAAMVENMKDLETENASLKERNEILMNHVTSLEETTERDQNEIRNLKQLLTERRDSAELFRILESCNLELRRYKDANSAEQLEKTNDDNRKLDEELNEKKQE